MKTKSKGLSTAAKSVLNATGVNANNAPFPKQGNNPSKKLQGLDWTKLAANSNKPPWVK
jgi:hypothetical protein